MKITVYETTIYRACKAMHLLRSPRNTPLKSKDIESAMGLEARAMGKILSRLASAGLLQAGYGPKGGFEVTGKGQAASAGEIAVSQIDDHSFFMVDTLKDEHASAIVHRYEEGRKHVGDQTEKPSGGA